MILVFILIGSAILVSTFAAARLAVKGAGR